MKTDKQFTVIVNGRVVLTTTNRERAMEEMKDNQRRGFNARIEKKMVKYNNREVEQQIFA